MKKIIGIIHPFDNLQTLYVYQDGNKLDFKQVTIDEIPETIFSLSQNYDVYQVNLSGAQSFSQKLAKEIQKEEATKYRRSKLTIKCI